jgi:hypothetical protein
VPPARPELLELLAQLDQLEARVLLALLAQLEPEAMVLLAQLAQLEGTA